MTRVIIAVIVGYVLSIVLTVLGLFVAWTIFGVEGAFADNSTMASTQWSLTDGALVFVASVVAGAMAAAIGRNSGRAAAKALAGVMLVLGLAFALMGMGGEPQARPADWTGREVGFAEAGALASDPAWFSFTIPFVGALGVLTGGNLVGKRD